MTELLLWRFLKFCALMLIAGATVGAFVPERLSTRQRIVYVGATSGMALMWIAGYGLLRTAGLSMGAPWIGPSILLSMLWLYALVWSVEREDRRRLRWGLASAVPLVIALFLMVFRPG